jgi:predicted site-specific integrase-resolvase
VERQQILIGYARASTVDQQAGFEAQLVELNTYGCERTYQEQVSAVATRTQLESGVQTSRGGQWYPTTVSNKISTKVGQALSVGYVLTVTRLGDDVFGKELLDSSEQGWSRQIRSQ